MRNHAEALYVYTNAYIVEKDVRTPANTLKNVRMHQNKRKMQNSPDTPEIEKHEPTDRWRRVNVDAVDVYIPLKALIEVLATASPKTLSLDRSRVETSRQQREMPKRGLAMAMENGTVRTARLAAATSTRNQWKKHRWLEVVSTIQRRMHMDQELRAL